MNATIASSDANEADPKATWVTGRDMSKLLTNFLQITAN